MIFYVLNSGARIVENANKNNLAAEFGIEKTGLKRMGLILG